LHKMSKGEEKEGGTDFKLKEGNLVEAVKRMRLGGIRMQKRGKNHRGQTSQLAERLAGEGKKGKKGMHRAEQKRKGSEI